MKETRPIFAYIAFTDDTWNGACAPEPELADDWLAKMANAGCTIKPVYSRQEYQSELERLK